MSDILGIFNKLAPQQKIILGVATLGSIILIIVLFGLLNQPSYSTLYTNIHEEDAARIVEELNNKKIPYKLDNGGTTIQVPEEMVHQTRLDMASKGIPSSGIVGYEIFDQSTLGMSEFIQRLNFKRALEGELARTIIQQEGIESARVHIVVPEKSVFKAEQKETTASIVIKLKNGYSLDPGSIAAITKLVSSSVEGLDQNRVSLIDSKGRLLSKDLGDDNLTASTSKQYEVRQNIENYLSGKAQTLLDNVLGYGNSMVQVNVELDFDQVEKTMETYDPESQIAISEQTIKTENTGSNMVDSSAQTSENSTVNYEISKSIERVIQGSGNIKKLTVAAVINEIPKKVEEDGKVKIVYEPRPQDQLVKLEQLVKNSVGFDEERKDNFSLVNIPFETNSIEEFPEEELNNPGLFDFQNIDQIINIIIVLIGIISSLLFIKSLMTKIKKEKILIGTVNPAELAYGTSGGSSSMENLGLSKGKQSKPLTEGRKRELLPIGDLEDEISDEAALKKNQQDKIANYVSKNPIDAAKLINSWLHDEEEV
jgi:flagellar M-ring protein FliF